MMLVGISDGLGRGVGAELHLRSPPNIHLFLRFLTLLMYETVYIDYDEYNQFTSTQVCYMYAVYEGIK